MTLTVCWSAKGGSGTTCVAAALALSSTADSLLVDLDGELPAALGVPEPSGQGLSDWFSSDAPERAVLDLAVDVAGRHAPRATRPARRSPGNRRDGRRCAPSSASSSARGDRRCRLRGTAASAARRAGTQSARDAARATSSLSRACRASATGRHRARRGAGPEPHRRRCRSRRRCAGRRPDHGRPGDRPRRRRRPARRTTAERDAQVAAGDEGGGMTAMSQGIDAATSTTASSTALCRAAEAEPGSAEAAVREHVRRLAPLADAIERERLVDAAVARLDGLGPLDALIRDASVDEVLVNGGGEIWVERAGALERRGSIAAAELVVVIERILAPLGRRLDRTTPIVDARLDDGTRVCAVIPPVSVGGTILSLRRFRTEPLPLDRLRRPVSHRSARRTRRPPLQHGHLRRDVDRQDVAALEPARAHRSRRAHRAARGHGRVGARSSTISSASRPGQPPTTACAAISVEQLLHTALRLRPDRLVVGEVRGPEVLGLVQALNTGHDGSWSTCHANSALDALHRLETLVVQAAPAWPLRAIRDHLVRCIDAVVHVERTAGSARRVSEIAEVVDGDGVPATRPIVVRGERVATFSRSRMRRSGDVARRARRRRGHVTRHRRAGDPARRHGARRRAVPPSDVPPRHGGRRPRPARPRRRNPRPAEVADWCDARRQVAAKW